MKCDLILALSVLLACLLPTVICAQEDCSCMGEHGWAEVNGQRLYYSVAGEGKPVVLLHGNGGSHEQMSLIMEQLASVDYRVYALDSRGQGANEPLTEYHYSDMAEDVYQFIKAMGMERPAVYGWSDGGIIAIEMALMYPASLSLLAVSGVNLDPSGAPCLLELGDIEEVSPLERLMMTEPQIDPRELSKIIIPALVTAGENDFVMEEHTRLIAESLPDAQLYLLESEDHGSYIVDEYTMGDLLARFLQDHDY